MNAEKAGRCWVLADEGYIMVDEQQVAAAVDNNVFNPQGGEELGITVGLCLLLGT